MEEREAARRRPERPFAEHSEQIAQREWLWNELQSLPPRQRVAIVLRFYEDLTEAQTAEAMGVTVGTVKSQVSDALKNLRKKLGPDTDVELVPNEMVVTS